MAHQSHPATCQALLSQLDDYLDGELEAALCAEIEQHLAGCDDCRVLADTTRKTITLYRQHRRVELPTGMMDRLRQALEAAGCGITKE
ncbi:MAG: zf-HC2 domain-containing protein [Anaerolineae bacterium]|nr:zf-HC2 domain-containing protein [Anaerolineae bacterium]